MARVFGQFELLENIGSGRLAELFRARAIHEPDMPTLVVKRIRPEFRYDTNLMARFVEGAQMVVGLEHPNIAVTYDAGVLQGRYYAALEYVAGKDLRHIQNKFETTRRALPVPVAMFLMNETCRGLEFLHTATDEHNVPLDLVHADVSPQNVMVSFGGAVKLINVEGAWFRQKGWASTQGKGAYMSPEQAAATDVDQLSDIFSAGIVFWEILTGKSLFEGKNERDILRAVAEAEIKAPSDANRMVPADLDEIILQALQRDPAKRFPSMRAMRQALQAFTERSRLTFSSKQISSWMKMTFPEEARKAPAERSSGQGESVQSAAKAPPSSMPSLRMVNQPSAAEPRRAAPAVLAPELPAADLPVDNEDTDVDPFADDATRIDPTSQMIADLERESSAEPPGNPAENVVIDVARSSSPTPSEPTPAAMVQKTRDPTPPPPPIPPATHDRAVGGMLSSELDGIRPESGRTETLDEAMRAHRKLEKEVRTSEVPSTKPSETEAADGSIEPVKRALRDQKRKSSAVPIVPPDPADLAGKVDERKADELDAAMKARRKLDKRLTGEAPMPLRIERSTTGLPPTPDERKSMLAILLIVGFLLIVGLGVLAWLMLVADAEQSEDVRRPVVESRSVARAEGSRPQLPADLLLSEFFAWRKEFRLWLRPAGSAGPVRGRWPAR